ncbi:MULTISPECIES: M15 family metallopeptidase [Thermomonospora]|uniref:Peptidase M15B and M15C DD-carboxypeptidase VanY/endolysin n=1 Tax=Thermomonospora curvata (strain ATCC 19995 / DSM 43183 / JCM 3096 / KCTC 9072 / NBRC 15933 / NCIMB 10081 / Henssen B9) TaxID=471852 RepID=D1A6L4_THECD|nr:MULTISPECIES: M15 family metallopeptidase [Thermomonospora]ACY96489.1 peptidase M15B and M15C DD-carboxypeptidase VanY/endolysin [Thermomonospora curvata DSM 43183]PKK15545.1 MAG: peptidase M15 [Thermomonospora sp. CIF 1]
MLIQRSAALGAAFLVVTLLAVLCAPQGWVPAAAARSATDPVERLRREADKAREDLEKATKKWESGKKELAKSQEKLRRTLQELGKAEAELNRIRAPLAQLANTVYQNPGSTGMLGLLNGGDSMASLRMTADLAHIAMGQQKLIQRADELQERYEKLASTAQELQSRNAVEQTRLQQQIQALKQRSAELTAQLTAMLDQLDVSRERRLLLSCPEDLVADARRYPNGLIPSKYLCPLPQKGEYLRADAARAFYQLNTAYRKRFGRDICVTDSYRSLSEQQQIYYRRPGFAAIPGRSNHGLGTAVDLCGGVQISGSVQFNWMEANSRKYGWFHPSWAYSNPFEPWHWEFGSEH